MCIFVIVSSLEGRPSGFDPCPLQGPRRSPEKKSFVPSCQFFLAPKAPGTCPALRGPAEALQFPHGRVISERWTELFGQPIGKKEKEKPFYPVCLLPHRRVSWEDPVGMGHGTLFQASGDPRRGGDWNGMRLTKHGSPFTERAFTSGKSVKCHVVCLLGF